MARIQEIQNKDNEVNNEILSCLNMKNPQSFFMLAGAGSGKTRTLVEVLEEVEKRYGEELYLYGRKIAVITYTNAACNEIISRLKNSDLFSVSTIHSFSWRLICSFQRDIKNYVRIELENDIDELQKKQVKAHNTTTKTYIERELKLKNKSKKLMNLDSIKKFIYSPDGDNTSKNSLNHSQVLKIFVKFLEEPLMQRILIRMYPMLLIDECQDTNKHVMEAILKLQESNSDRISIGLFGDMMQRIYSDGKHDLNKVLHGWKSPMKQMNYRCPKRIVRTLNKLREDVDGLVQYPNDRNEEGVIRIFLCSSSINKIDVEKLICSEMHSLTSDDGWINSVQSLILEHQMAAERLGFGEFYSHLHSSNKYKNKVTEGKVVEAKFFGEQVLPLVGAYKNDEKYELAKLAKKYFKQFNEGKEDLNVNRIQYVKESVEALSNAWTEAHAPNGFDLLRIIKERDAIQLPDSLEIVLELQDEQKEYQNDELEIDNDFEALEKVLNLEITQVEKYTKYMNEEAGFATHQGVKGLEYPRVMLIINDSEARGFMFSYEKLFSIKERSDTDIRNEKEGKETTIERTKRLFYVGCSRAEKSLAIVLYTSNPEEAKENIVTSGWFNTEEVRVLNNLSI